MLIERTLRYLGGSGMALNDAMRQLLASCEQEVRALRPAFTHARFTLAHVRPWPSRWAGRQSAWCVIMPASIWPG